MAHFRGDRIKMAKTQGPFFTKRNLLKLKKELEFENYEKEFNRLLGAFLDHDFFIQYYPDNETLENLKSQIKDNLRSLMVNKWKDEFNKRQEAK